jgi:prevent-host-death family protein
MAAYNIYEAKTHLSALVEQAVNGEEVILARAGKPVAKIVAIKDEKRPKKRKVFGQNFLGITYVAPDAFDPMTEEELKEWGL